MRYKLWDKQSDIYTLGQDEKSGKSHWTADEYINEFAPWARIPGVKIIVGGGVVNGTVFIELNAAIEHYKRLGCIITSDMSDDEILVAIEEFEDAPPPAIVSVEERIAAALEFQNLLNM